jgi:ribosome-associated protein
MPLCGRRLTKDGVLIIVARAHRTQERNRAEAREKLIELIARAATAPTPRRPTKPTKASKRRRLDAKTARAKIKRARGKVRDE